MSNDLTLVQQFVNTLELEPGIDELPTPPALADWLAARGLLDRRARVAQADLRRAIAVREALRELLLANNGVGVDVDVAAAVLDDAARRARMTVRFVPGGPRLEPAASGIDGALGRLLVVVAAAMADGTWERLKACRAETCRWVFYDHAKNRSRTWCSMRVCGNRTKARAYRRRHS